MIRNIFLTGEKQVGKSTLLDGLIGRRGIVHSGFRTMPLIIQGVRKGNYLHGFVELPPFVNDSVVSIRSGAHSSVPVPQVFEDLGCAILRASLVGQAPAILLDELGASELTCSAFSQLVLDCLEGQRPVVGVLQKKTSPLLEAIKTRPDTLVLTVTVENREALVKVLDDAWEEAIGGAAKPGVNR